MALSQTKTGFFVRKHGTVEGSLLNKLSTSLIDKKINQSMHIRNTTNYWQTNKQAINSTQLAIDKQTNEQITAHRVTVTQACGHPINRHESSLRV